MRRRTRRAYAGADSFGVREAPTKIKETLLAWHDRPGGGDSKPCRR